MDKLVSIIIPAYNVEKYITNCLNSIIKQNYTNFEVLIVENGSTDATYEIINDFTKRDERIKLFKSDIKNVSKARNIGIENSTGEYVMFIDADDFISADYVESAVESIESRDDIDFVIMPYNQYHSDLKNKLHDYKCKAGIYIGDEIFNFFSLRNVWARLFRSKIIAENNIKFNELLSFGEDFLFATEYLMHSNVICLSDKGCYFYYHGREDQITSNASDVANIERIFYAVNLIESKIINCSRIETFTTYIDREYAHLVLGYTFAATPIRKLSNKNVKKILSKYKDRLVHVRLNDTISPAWLKVWWNRFMFFYTRDKYGYFFKFMRCYRNYVLQPFGIKYK